jgi:hypothetical protein
MCQHCGQVNSSAGGCRHCWVIPDPVDFGAALAASIQALQGAGVWYDTDKKPKCECGNKENPIGQGHSDWCDLFKQEM